MIVKEESWCNIPLLHIVEEEFIGQEIPVAIFFHGFTSAKEHNLHFAYNLAKQGVRVILPDAHLHGVRSESLDEVELGLRFWEVVLTSIEELNVIREELFKRELVTTAAIGIGGTSMGGITSLGSLKMYDWINSAIIMMGAPNFVELANAQIGQFERRGFELPISIDEKNQLLENLATFDLTKDQFLLKQRPVYFWHGMNDTIVPYEPTYNFYEAVKADYKDVPERLIFESDEGAGHEVSRHAMLGATNWLASQLKV
ncbi:prolyl oligopeptidase family serine peptidase [Sporosarcina sp. G11-34]|uniref:prolyl oligopeptidase family serine peptidase n=1 Tax=Sporosarcina sp. G11-34 TaxID=2849605 RepID=UPI0022A8D8D7|nr:prolyl oligopeptidase family serine peptidase [Sporosarcina sp. G11-34]MCZ2258999.1 prolyl oligopeptidase family serine peptidase [Sporosarcina sp. G11-34]